MHEDISLHTYDPGTSDFAAIYQHYSEPIYRYLYQQTGNAHDAEDLTATTFCKALVSLRHYQEQGRFEAWLFSIARHTLRDWQRRQRPLIDVDAVAPVLPDAAPAPDEMAVEAEQAHTLHHFLHQLPEEQRQAIILRFFDGMSNGEAAAVLGRSIGSVKMLVHRAIGRLRSQYQQAHQSSIVLSVLLAPLVATTMQPALQPIRTRVRRRSSKS